MEILEKLQSKFSSKFEISFNPRILDQFQNSIIEICSSDIYMSCYHEELQINSEVIKCVIRILAAPIIKIIGIATNELNLLEAVNEIQYFNKPIFLAFEQVNSENQARYIFVTKRNNRTLADFIDADEAEKITLVKQLTTALAVLSKFDFYYLGLSQNFISVDDNDILILDYLFLADYKLISQNCSEMLKFFDDVFLAPELLIMKRHFNYEMIEKITRNTTEVFSLGLIISYLFKQQINFVNLGFDDIDPSMYFNYLIHSESILSISSSYKNGIKRKINVLREMIFLCVNRIENIMINDLCVSSLDPIASERDNLLNLLKYLDIPASDSIIPNNPSINSFVEILQDFQDFIELASSKLNSSETIQNFRVSILTTKERILKSSYFAYLESPCNSNSIQLIDGVLYFIYNLLRDLNEEPYLRLFRDKLFGCQKVFQFQEYFQNMMNIDEIIQDYILIGLFLIDIEND